MDAVRAHSTAPVDATTATAPPRPLSRTDLLLPISPVPCNTVDPTNMSLRRAIQSADAVWNLSSSRYDTANHQS
jgi:hypothetical protein